MKIQFNKPYKTGKELLYIEDAIERGKISGNGHYTQECHSFFEKRYGFRKCLLTTSCTDALEMAAILLDITPGDEVIMPAYTFVSTANAFVLRGATIVFCDSRSDHTNMNEELIEGLITAKTKAIVAVHYAGMACKMDAIMEIADRHGLFVVEDAAQAVDSYFVDSEGQKHPLGGIGHLGAFSFHETKNIICGEGGMLVVNDERFEKRSEIIWEKGTNRTAFFRGEVDKYGWVDIGSSFLMSELNAAFLLAQLENLDEILQKRRHIWETYDDFFASEFTAFLRPNVPDWATNNGHMYYLVCESLEKRTLALDALKSVGVGAVFHYQNLSSSKMGGGFNQAQLDQAERYTNCLFRLPLFPELDAEKVFLKLKNGLLIEKTGSCKLENNDNSRTGKPID